MNLQKAFKRTAVTTLASAALAVPNVADAKPLSFEKPRMSFTLGLDAFDYFMGDFGAAADPGLSVFVDVSIQAGYFGAALRAGSARAFTKKNILPYDNGVQFVYFTAAPRFNFAPLDMDLTLFLQPEISARIFSSNTLVQITGNTPYTGAVGGSIGAQMNLGILAITTQIACQYDWMLKTLYLSGGISVGITSIIE